VFARMIRLHPRPFIISVTGASIFALATVGAAYVLGEVTDRVVVPHFEQGPVSTATVVGAVAAIVGMGVLKAVGIVTRRLAAFVLVANIGATLRSKVAAHYQQVPYEYHQRTPTGELLAHAGADVDVSAEALAPVPYSVGVLVILTTTLGWLLATDPYLAVVGLIVFPALIGVNLAYQRAVEAPAEEAQELIGTVSNVAHESFEGALVVKTLGAEQLEADRFGAAAGALRDAKIREAVLRANFETSLDAFPALAVIALLPMGAWRVDTGAVTVGTLVSFVSLFTLLTWPLRLIGYVLSQIPGAVAGHDRVEAVLAEPPDPRPVRVGPHRHRQDLSGDGARLDVDNVSFAFGSGFEPGAEPGAEPVSHEPALKGVTLHVAPGRTVALVGATASGKSTLLTLLAGLVDPQEGEIRLDGRPLAELSVAELRDEVAMAFQEPFLFGDAIAENVLLGPPDDNGPDHDRMVAAATLAGAHDFVARLPSGYDTVVGERGATLSGGQRQRVALARALARRPRLLLLDDATSSVDPTTEGRVLAALSEHLTATTTVIVASRPSTIAMADEVVYLDDGRVVDRGSHQDLLARQRGYARLVRAYELDRARHHGPAAEDEAEAEVAR